MQTEMDLSELLQEALKGSFHLPFWPSYTAIRCFFGVFCWMSCFGSAEFGSDPQKENPDRLRASGKGFHWNKKTLELRLNTSALFSQSKPKQTLTCAISSSQACVPSQQCRVPFHRIPSVSRWPVHPLIISKLSAHIQPIAHATRRRTFPAMGTVSSGDAPLP